MGAEERVLGAGEWRGPAGPSLQRASPGSSPAGVSRAHGILPFKFPLDDSTLREAEAAATRFVFGPWCNGFPDYSELTAPPLNGPCGTRPAGDGDHDGASAVGASINHFAATTSGGAAWSPVQMVPVPVDFGWAGMSGVLPTAATAAHVGGANAGAAGVSACAAMSAPAPAMKPAPPPQSVAHAQKDIVEQVSERPTGERAGAGSGRGRQKQTEAQTSTPTSRVGGSLASPSSSPTGQDSMRPTRTWANIVSQDQEAASGVLVQTPTSAWSGMLEEPRKDTIIDYLLHLARSRADAAEGKVNGHLPDLPEEFRKLKSCLDSGVAATSRARYARRGMKNDANNCYVNVVIQSMLPCSALMQLLSLCASVDPERPFYTGMVQLWKEFHSRRPDSHEAFNVLQMPQVNQIISAWQQVGAQQDAGEFLFYMLNGMHEECKWNAVPAEPSAPTGDEAGRNRKVEYRSTGVHEDSPILRVFGGLLRSSVRSRHAKADSVSFELFNHLILDISSPGVDSVWTALEAYCGAEAVNEGRATKRLQFKLLPKVLIVSLKRFSYDKDSDCPQKIKKAVRYEEKLAFDPAWLADDVEPQEYQLTSVICHHGESANGGHYNAAVRYNAEWYMYDDALVRQMEPREVMNQQLTAYLLIYQSHGKVDFRP